MTKTRNHATKRGHKRHDKNILSVADLLNSIDDYTYSVVSKEQAIVNKALTMKKPTNNKELRQVRTIVREVMTMNNNLKFVKEASYAIPTAPRGFLERINGLIDSCNDYINSHPILKLEHNIELMERVENVDMTGFLLYDDETSRHVPTANTQEDNKVTTRHERKVVESNTTYSLEDVLSGKQSKRGKCLV